MFRFIGVKNQQMQYVFKIFNAWLYGKLVFETYDILILWTLLFATHAQTQDVQVQQMNEKEQQFTHSALKWIRRKVGHQMTFASSKRRKKNSHFECLLILTELLLFGNRIHC